MARIAPHPKEDTVIPPVVSLREAGRQLGLNPTFIKGVALGLGIRIERAGRTLVIARKDLDRIRREVGRREAAEAMSLVGVESSSS